MRKELLPADPNNLYFVVQTTAHSVGAWSTYYMLVERPPNSNIEFSASLDGGGGGVEPGF